MGHKTLNKKQIFLISLIPAGFTVVNMLMFSLLGIPFYFGFSFFLIVIWILVGWKSRLQIKNYGKALVLFNWLAFVCIAFAVVYYNLLPLDGIRDGAPLLPTGITQYVIGDVFAGLYASPFLFGLFLPIYGWGNLGIMVVSVNTILGLLLFSIGYFASAVKGWAHKNAEIKD